MAEPLRAGDQGPGRGQDRQPPHAHRAKPAARARHVLDRRRRLRGQSDLRPRLRRGVRAIAPARRGADRRVRPRAARSALRSRLQAEIMPYHQASIWADQLFHARADRARGLRRARAAARCRCTATRSSSCRPCWSTWWWRARSQGDGDGPSGRADAPVRFVLHIVRVWLSPRSQNALLPPGPERSRSDPARRRGAAELGRRHGQRRLTLVRSRPGGRCGRVRGAGSRQVAGVGGGRWCGRRPPGRGPCGRLLAGLGLALDQVVAQRFARDEARLDAPQRAVDHERRDRDLRRVLGREPDPPRVRAVRPLIAQRAGLARDGDARQERPALADRGTRCARCRASTVDEHHVAERLRGMRARSPCGTRSARTCIARDPWRRRTRATMPGRGITPPLAIVAPISAPCSGDMCMCQNPAAVRAQLELVLRHVERARPRLGVERQRVAEAERLRVAIDARAVEVAVGELGDHRVDRAADRFFERGAAAVARGIVDQVGAAEAVQAAAVTSARVRTRRRPRATPKR